MLVVVGCSSDDGTAIDAIGPIPTIELAVLPTSISITQGDSSSVNATVIRTGSFSGRVDLRILGAPNGVTFIVSNDDSSSPVTSATLRIRVGPDTSPGVYDLELQGTAAGVNQASTILRLTIVEWLPECPGGIDLCLQWALSATASSEYTTNDWAAKQAVGRPTVVGCGDDPGAWASLDPNTVEWLELTFPVAVRPSEIHVYENYGAGSIVSVQVKDAAGTYHTVHTDQPRGLVACRILRIPVSGISSPISVVRLNIDQRTTQDWNEIDAVKLIGRK